MMEKIRRWIFEELDGPERVVFFLVVFAAVMTIAQIVRFLVR